MDTRRSKSETHSLGKSLWWTKKVNQEKRWTKCIKCFIVFLLFCKVLHAHLLGSSDAVRRHKHRGEDALEDDVADVAEAGVFPGEFGGVCCGVCCGGCCGGCCGVCCVCRGGRRCACRRVRWPTIGVIGFWRPVALEERLVRVSEACAKNDVAPEENNSRVDEIFLVPFLRQ